MSKVQIEVSENAKGWIDRFRCEEDAEAEINAIHSIMSYLIDDWLGGFISDPEAKSMLATLNNAESIIKSLGE